MQADSW